MCPASLKMSSLPIRHLLLLLLALHAPQAQGRSTTKPWTHTAIKYDNVIKEIEAILYSTTLPPQVSLDPNEIYILEKETLLKRNLDEFLNATRSFKNKGENIRNNLEQLKIALPTSTSMENPIVIQNGDWSDFQRKMTKYLQYLRNYIRKL